MASQDAKAVAHEVLDTLGKGKKISLRKIIKKHGYAQNTADNPKNVIETDSYKSIVDPFIQKMVDERDAAIKRMIKVRGKAKYRDLVDSIDKMTKNIQLLGGKKTALIGIEGFTYINPEDETDH